MSRERLKDHANSMYYDILETDGLTYYTPAAAGLGIIADYYNEKIGELIIICDHSKDHRAFSLRKFLNEEAESKFKQISESSDISPLGIILYCSAHSTPILLADDNVIIIFESVSQAPGDLDFSYYKSYERLAAEYPQYNFFFNHGIRQADFFSCIVDAMAILKDAVKIKDIAKVLEERIVTEESENIINRRHIGGIRRSRASSKLLEMAASTKTEIDYLPKAENFHLFYMPEELLKTAQISYFLQISNADGEKKLSSSKGLTLHEKRSKHFDYETSRNHYLFDKGKNYAKIIDERVGDTRTPAESIMPESYYGLLSISKADCHKK
jgi:hypothetical protein